MDGKWGRIPGRQGPRAVKPERPALLFSLQCSGTPGQRSCPPQTVIINNSLTKPAQFEPSTANARTAWRLVSRVSGRKGRDDITGVPHESLSVLSLISAIFAFCSPALAHCRVTDLNLEPAISRQNELRQSANAQVVRALRTL